MNDFNLICDGKPSTERAAQGGRPEQGAHGNRQGDGHGRQVTSRKALRQTASGPGHPWAGSSPPLGHHSDETVSVVPLLFSIMNNASCMFLNS